ncbi:hypothetical protein EDD22DRAFT_850273 [Suillus occidentalis]|nr:hypothetical protein EDD22DRAFT_850273 [Suillus occidentalis]
MTNHKSLNRSRPLVARQARSLLGAPITLQTTTGPKTRKDTFEANMEPSNRPAKRLRLQGPDGFQVTKNISKPAYKPPPPFVSSFDLPKAEPSTKVPVDKQEKSKDSTCVRERPHNPFTAESPDFGDTSLGRGANLKGKGKETSIRPAGNHKRPNPFITASNTGAETSCVPILKRLTTVPSKLASVHPPISCQKPHSAPLRPLRALKPPSFVLDAPENASYPTKDGAGAELLSLFLQQHGHNFVTPFEREIQRGIGLSPRKNKSAKGKFVRSANITDLRDQCYVVLFPHFAEPSRNFEEGRDVLAWMPWYKAMLSTVVPREVLGRLSVEPLLPPRSVIILPRWHIMQAD